MLNFRKYSENGPALIIMHGLFGMLDNWHQIAQKLSENYSVISLDMPNHGSSSHYDRINYEEMAQLISEFLKEQNIDSAYIVGHSMGGKVAMSLAMQFPEIVKKLIVVDIAPKAYKPGHLDIFDAILNLDISKFQTRGEIDENIKEKLPDFGVRQFILKNLGRNSDGSFFWKMNVKGIFNSYEDIIADLKIEHTFEKDTLFIKGSLSKYIKESDYGKIHALFPNSVIKEVEGAGHWVHAEAPDKVIDLISGFLK